MDLTVFENSMKKWLLLDTQVRIANQKLREMRNEHGTLTKSVCEYIREHKMENRKIETSDSKIEYYEKQSHSSLSYSFLVSSPVVLRKCRSLAQISTNVLAFWWITA